LTEATPTAKTLQTWTGAAYNEMRPEMLKVEKELYFSHECRRDINLCAKQKANSLVNKCLKI